MHFFSSRPFPSCIYESRRPFPSCIYELVRPFPSAHWSLRPLPSCIFPSCIYESHVMHLWAPETISNMHLGVHETIAICTLVPETIAIMYFSSRRGRETSSSNYHAFFPFHEMGRTLGALKAMVFNFIMSRLQWQVYFISI